MWAGSPGHRVLRIRCHLGPPARRLAGDPTGARHRVPDTPGCRRVDYRLVLSSFSTNEKCLAVPQRWDLSQTCWHKNTELDYYTAKNASRDLCHELIKNAILQHHNKIRPSELPSGQFTAVALVSNCRSDVALFSIQAVALGLTSSALLITKKVLLAK